MKVVIATIALGLLGILVQGLTDEQKAKMQNYHKECAASSGADPAVIRQVKEGKLPQDPKINEFLFCLFKKAGFVNESGDLQPDVIRTKLSDDLSEADVKMLLEKCNNSTGKDLAEKTANVYKCYLEATPARIPLAI